MQFATPFKKNHLKKERPIRPQFRVTLDLWQLILLLVCVVAIAMGIYARFHNLFFPQHFVFDEALFVPQAQTFLAGQYPVHDHPPLGILILSLGIKLFGDTSFGWRIFPALFGLATIPLAGFFTKTLFKSKKAGLIAAAFVAVDGLLAVYSRLALFDGILFFLIIATLTLTLLLKKDWGFIFGVGISLGLACILKMNGAWIALPIALYLIQQKRHRLIIPTFFISTLIYVGTILLFEVLTHHTPYLTQAWDWQQFAWNLHADAAVRPPHGFLWASKWYTWPAMLVPVQDYLWKQTNLTYFAIYTIANPMLLVATDITLIASLVLIIRWIFQPKLPSRSQLRFPFYSLLIVFFTFLLPWTVLKRFSLLYHYIPSYFALAFLLAGFLAWGWDHWKFGKPFTLAVLVVILSGGIYFLPLSTADPMSSAAYNSRILLPSWEHPEQFNIQSEPQ